ncbi:MAG: hypothetical protein MZV49_24355 [Rhodopseudomonas palustris]|nr:hypothetical protein [Rhodopseudomonas palustris]
MRTKAIEHFVGHFDPAKSDSATLKEAVERYVPQVGQVGIGSGPRVQGVRAVAGGRGRGRGDAVRRTDRESSAFYDETFPKNRFLSEARRPGAEIMLEEGGATERQKLAQDAVSSVRKSLPIEDIPLFNEFMNETVFGEQMPERKMAEELGIQDHTIHRKISKIKAEITRSSPRTTSFTGSSWTGPARRRSSSTRPRSIASNSASESARKTWPSMDLSIGRPPRSPSRFLKVQENILKISEPEAVR